MSIQSKFTAWLYKEVENIYILNFSSFYIICKGGEEGKWQTSITHFCCLCIMHEQEGHIIIIVTSEERLERKEVFGGRNCDTLVKCA